MRMQDLVIGLAAFAVLGGCGRTAGPKEMEKLVNAAWSDCAAVEPRNVTIESQDRKTVRYTYVLRMRTPGKLTGKGVPCPEGKVKMIEMFFNKDMVELETGDEATVTQEASKS
ncbi:hypothetical protein DSM104443_03348 [Usitatibacter rugosus]|uniref:Lipoprotein n=1 Tax=Usitatibacter rugosus TaxID=2732067 RepID=A0A6M4H0U4_9PROT|nr:hypothetical protein [Usitatibacter rugosus]QJR12263.1 hypothetical protein DSM104443_03348 [Usitatibacter rugosus]